MEYQSAVKLLDGLWGVTLDELSPEQAAAWSLAALPSLKWDDLSPKERQSVAAQHDQQHDPANADENAFWFRNACDIADVEREIAKRELLPEKTATEIEAKERLLSDSRKRLVDLKSAQFKQSTVVVAPFGAQESDKPPVPVLPEKQLITGVDRNKIIATFQRPIGTTEGNWSKTLSSPPKWLASARVSKGKPSVSALWNPAKFAMALCEKKYMTVENLTAVMRRDFANWLPEWEKYTASFD